MGGGVLVAGLLFFFFSVVDAVAAAAAAAPGVRGSEEAESELGLSRAWESDQESLLQSCENVRGGVWIRPMSCGGFNGS